MLRLLLNALLVLVAARFLFGLFRWMGRHPEESGRGSPHGREDAAGRAGRSRAGAGRSHEGAAPNGAARADVDRSGVIDVTFTEEGPGGAAPASADGAASGSPAGSDGGSPAGAPAGSAAAGSDREAR